MGSNLYSAFETSLDKTNLILKDIEQVYGWPKERRNQSYAAMRTVLHLIRDRLPVSEAAQFASNLPVLVRGVYYDGWNPDAVPIKLKRDDFLFEVRQSFRYDIDGGIENLVRTVLDALRRHVPEGEWEDVRSNMPKELAPVLS
jgi:uncharacterized protein (DUF2267 family)